MIYDSTLKWDAIYDVIVIGFGGAGAGAARFAADQKAKVLLIDSAPEGQEGGNTRYAGGAFAWSDNFDDLRDYYKQTYYPFKYDPKALDTFVNNVLQMKEYSQKYFGIDAQYTGRRPQGEYPEYDHAVTMRSQTMTAGMYNGGFWKLLRKKVYERLDQIDVWFSSPAEYLIQDPASKTILGVQIKRHGIVQNVAAKNGVVLSCGGFENNQDMVQTFLGQGSLAPIGTLYNKGKGIDLAVEAGARLWHMSNYDSHGFSLNEGKPREKFAYMINWQSLFNGSIFVAGDDGTRYYREDEEDRHGYKYNHGNWIMLPNQNHPHIVMDQKQYDQLANDSSDKAEQIKQLISYADKADSIEELAEKISAPKLAEAVADFNFQVTETKRDMVLNRKIETMRAFGKGPYYAIAIRHNILHTHGGARRNEKCEVLDMENNVIPHLYEAGELGDIFATKYIGANSIADLLISGKIAGENAAWPKRKMAEVDVVTNASENPDLKSDAHATSADYEADANQGIGISENGINDAPIVVRVTLDDNKIAKIETLQEKETPSLGGKAIPVLTKKMLSAQTTDVDAVSGASTTSAAFKEAVNEAIKNAKKQ
ncbi:MULTISPECIES: FAD-binding protein [unclassified Lactobacillus]|uniref:FAD-binding protein n=1 Tax=unclassified Lactobacillus TaxID=2620435 RepID=UPI00226A9ECC|nr:MULTISPECIES: FAD-binding protein [unclassified Lactobacillus]MCX8721010.1 FAD-binding protein [Lactobacillus sp. B4010]MCX8732161.1 FAD-binding protein [Lactobacillus sp. B4015]MCX8734152.1 FAD-binding protein [Lactobacillus sp. B4012]